jgi:hypothetical protein
MSSGESCSKAVSLIISLLESIETQLQSSGWNGAIQNADRLRLLSMDTAPIQDGLSHNITASLDDLILNLLVTEIPGQATELSRLTFKKV